MIVPFERLSAEALSSVLEEYVTRDGTEWTEASTKIEAARRALERGDLVLVFDPDTESCNLLTPDEAHEAHDAHDAHEGEAARALDDDPD